MRRWFRAAGDLQGFFHTAPRAAPARLELERLAPTLEVLVELPADVLQAARHPQHTAPETLGEAVCTAVGVERDRAQALVRRSDEQLADRAVGQVVGDIDQPRRRGG